MIKVDVKMPKNCQNCPFTYLDTGDDAYWGRNTTNCVFDHSEIVYSDERPEMCPLREV